MSAEYLQLTHRHERTSEQAEESDCLLRSGVNSLYQELNHTTLSDCCVGLPCHTGDREAALFITAGVLCSMLALFVAIMFHDTNPGSTRSYTYFLWEGNLTHTENIQIHQQLLKHDIPQLESNLGTLTVHDYDTNWSIAVVSGVQTCFLYKRNASHDTPLGQIESYLQMKPPIQWHAPAPLSSQGTRITHPTDEQLSNIGLTLLNHYCSPYKVYILEFDEQSQSKNALKRDCPRACLPITDIVEDRSLLDTRKIYCVTLEPDCANGTDGRTT